MKMIFKCPMVTVAVDGDDKVVGQIAAGLKIFFDMYGLEYAMEVKE